MVTFEPKRAENVIIRATGGSYHHFHHERKAMKKENTMTSWVAVWQVNAYSRTQAMMEVLTKAQLMDDVLCSKENEAEPMSHSELQAAMRHHTALMTRFWSLKSLLEEPGLAQGFQIRCRVTGYPYVAGHNFLLENCEEFDDLFMDPDETAEEDDEKRSELGKRVSILKEKMDLEEVIPEIKNSNHLKISKIKSL